MISAENSLQLLDNAHEQQILYVLIEQLNKDFQLSNVNYFINENESVEDVVLMLEKILSNLIQFNYDTYLNFIYRIDISEKELLPAFQLALEDQVKLISFLVFKREYNKVWFRLNFRK